MSKIGKLPIIVPSGTTVKLEEGLAIVTGPKGELKWQIPKLISVGWVDNQLSVTRENDSKMAKSLHGLVRSKLANMVQGVSVGYTKVMEIFGVGYRVEAKGETVVLNIGFSHPINLPLVPGTVVTVAKNEITVSGIDKEAVGEMAAQIRRLRKPEPYKGKGIKYQGEIVRRKAGKAAKTAA
ncbi:50S ribosomal protein L6 [Patescibacteria group bacterium]|nr:50S ribosomal protein L6 [Patescibacteria group bacterium]